MSLISNPPYNMKWNVPPFAQLQQRFCNCEIPPASNANYAFILTGLEYSERCVFILPCGILQGGLKQEIEIRKYLVEMNYVEAVILCPDKMFECTTIATCIIVLNKNKDTSFVEMIDMRQKYVIEKREQNGQYGGSSHTNRTYTKEIKTFTDELMDEAISCIAEKKNIPKFCKAVSIEQVKQDKYSLLASHYIEILEEEIVHRNYEDIVGDLNRVIKHKNLCKLTINESIAKSLGFDVNLYRQDQQDNELNELLVKIAGQKIEKSNYFSASKNKNEIRFENTSKEELSSILIMILNTWKQHIFYLNQEENRYLVELRDALLPELMSGKIEL